MWSDLRKGVFHTHTIYQLQQFITSDPKELLPRNLVSNENQDKCTDGENFRPVWHLNAKLWSSNFKELDVCGRPLFANPVYCVAIVCLFS